MDFFLLFITFFILFIILYFFFYRNSKDKDLMKKFYKSNIVLVISFIIAAFGLIYYNYESSLNLAGNSSDVVFVLDVSESMNAPDYQSGFRTYSRLDVAKSIIKDFVLKYPKNRYSLTIFSGDYTDRVPFTNDTNMFLTFLQDADSSSIVRGGNVIKEAFTSSLDRFKSEETSGAIIVLSDFEIPGKDKTFLENYLGNLNSLKSELQENNIKVFSIGLGSERGNNIPLGVGPFGNLNYKEDNFGNKVITKFDTFVFTTFSTILNTTKIYISTYDDYKDVVGKIKDLPSRTFETSLEVEADFSRYFMVISYIIFVLYMFFYYWERRKIKN